MHSKTVPVVNSAKIYLPECALVHRITCSTSADLVYLTAEGSIILGENVSTYEPRTPLRVSAGDAVQVTVSGSATVTYLYE